MTKPETKVGNIVYVEESEAFCGIMEGNEYEVTHVHDETDGFISVTNGSFFSSLNWAQGDRWRVVG